MRKILYRLISLLIFFVVLDFQLIAQKSLSLKADDNSWNTAYELFENNNFGASSKAFRNYLKTQDSSYSIMKMKAEYYIAHCSVELLRPTAELEMKLFIEKYPLSNFQQLAYLQMGEMKYREKKYQEALDWFLMVEIYDLDNNQRDNIEFKKAYSYFQIKNYDEAKDLFYNSSNKETIFSSPAKYYYGHIAYTQGKLETALNVFNSLKNDKVFKTIIPYYYTNIYFAQKNYKKVLEYSIPYIDKASVKRSLEISKLVGLSYYNTKQYDKAIEYLLKSKSENKDLPRGDMYSLAYSYYKIKNYSQAIPLFRKIGGKDALTQKACYVLADCCIALGDKKGAKAAFATTARMNFDKYIQEEAILNYAKINYELAYSPFNEIIRAFEVYLEKYPKSKRKDEVYDYLVKVYMSSKNYEQALISMDKISDKTTNLYEAYQRASYFRGVELFTQLNFVEAKEMFLLSSEYKKYNRTIAVENQYWLSEAEFRLGKYQLAVNSYKEYLDMPGSIVSETYEDVFYNLAYAYFSMGDYNSAIKNFNVFIDSKKPKEKLVSDTYNRLGDCFFANRNYLLAIESYSKSSHTNHWDADYAMFQKALCWGLLDKNEKKISELNAFEQKYPNSVFVDDSYFEIAQTQMLLMLDDDAISTYKKLIKEYPKSNLAVKSYLQLGLLNYSRADYNKALNYYKQVISSNVSVVDNKSALIGIKNIYVDMNQVSDYFSYVKLIGKGDVIHASEKDSLTYISAKRLFMSHKTKEGINAFDKYLELFPKGEFRINAIYYKSEAYIDQKSYDKAIIGLQAVLSGADNVFTQKALVAVSQLNYKKKNYADALQTYVRLEHLMKEQNYHEVSMPIIGQMRCNFFLKNYRDVIAICTKMLQDNKYAVEIIREARYYRAKSYFETESLNLSLADFSFLSREVQSFEGAESSYMVSKLLFVLEQFDDSEKQINNFIELGSPHQFWLAKCFLLLSDIYYKKEDLFQAKYTLQSIIDNYTLFDDGIINTSKEKLQKIMDEEQEAEINKKREEIEMEFSKKTETSSSNVKSEKNSNL